MSLTRWAALIGAVVGGAAGFVGCRPPPPCVGLECEKLCPAGTRIDYSADVQAGCGPGSELQDDGRKLRCERKESIFFVCRITEAQTQCGERGVKVITREMVVCNDAPPERTETPAEATGCGACDHVAECGFADRETCVSSCKAGRRQAVQAGASCSAQVQARDACLASLTCDELRRYNDAYQLGTIRDAPCGGEENGVTFSCTPQADVCRQVCGALERCGLSRDGFLKCGVQCVGGYQAAGTRRGAPCYNSLMNLHYCRVRSYSCFELRATATDLDAPERCFEERTAVKSACGVEVIALPPPAELF